MNIRSLRRWFAGVAAIDVFLGTLTSCSVDVDQTVHGTKPTADPIASFDELFVDRDLKAT